MRRRERRRLEARLVQCLLRSLHGAAGDLESGLRGCEVDAVLPGVLEAARAVAQSALRLLERLVFLVQTLQAGRLAAHVAAKVLALLAHSADLHNPLIERGQKHIAQALQPQPLGERELSLRLLLLQRGRLLNLVLPLVLATALLVHAQRIIEHTDQGDACLISHLGGFEQ